ncbi:amino acid ABC transporter permease [Paraburkholderia sp. MMS20-SJTR3]|uniref:Amino acid ABC transporter permease n=1 Tax=Paraburkholderia sejongensis TaxID=2886946 RepID=A0ABS8K3W9_9BURK|nr:amino acid ABC transporter permease [Paraburkholderia sp. MMS20-SJTR3]MCC8396860.1 amino acid ABC transporter permease [Paraburkholderia sp. MMS20-SJTR3]
MFAAVAIALIANGYLLTRLPSRAQIPAVRIELFALLIVFLSRFDLSLDFIHRKVGYLIIQGATTTLLISAISVSIAFVLALIGALAKLSSSGIAIGIATFYTSLFRGLPLLMQIFILYLGLPQLGFVVDPIPAGVTALSLCYGAYMTEIFRAGIQSIPLGQWNAARALGLTPYQMMRLVILPQALRVIIPPTGNQFIAMLKDSALVSVVGVWELTYVATTAGQKEFRRMEMLISASAIYWVMSLVLEVIQARIERTFRNAAR